MLAALEKLGQPIGVNDLHIAGHARSEGLVLVTNNTSEFGACLGLKWTTGFSRAAQSLTPLPGTLPCAVGVSGALCLKGRCQRLAVLAASFPKRIAAEIRSAM